MSRNSSEIMNNLKTLLDEATWDTLLPSEKVRRRSFNTEEREALYILAGGRCQNPQCGRILDGDWEPDHIVPFSKGGNTEISNGQALCTACNRQKGAKDV